MSQQLRKFLSLFCILISISQYYCNKVNSRQTDTPRYLNFGFADLTHSIVESATKTYQKMRDLHHDPPDVLRPLIMFAKEISDALNSTLCTIPNYQYGRNFKKAVPGFPTMLFQLLLTQNITFERTWLKHLNTYTNKNLPKFVVSISLPLIFAYCDAPRKKYESPWKFTMFTDSFDCYCWLLAIIYIGFDYK